MFDRLYIKELQIKLQYKDRRSVRRWCRNNGVRILSDLGSNRQFVLKDEFENSLNKIYSLNPISAENNKEEYIPKGTIESDFLSILLKT
ncbi:MAG: hypothetical protein HXX18_12000 [Bacteroidetes bacterium]|nr:hypothetical protein [Bacteroidota bacterium]